MAELVQQGKYPGIGGLATINRNYRKYLFSQGETAKFRGGQTGYLEDKDVHSLQTSFPFPESSIRVAPTALRLIGNPESFTKTMSNDLRIFSNTCVEWEAGWFFAKFLIQGQGNLPTFVCLT